MASKQEKTPTNSSRISNFFKMSIAERIAALNANGLLSQDDVQQLVTSNHQLNINAADKMIENVVGVFGLPMGVALNFLINNKDYAIPLVVEEPSIVAGLSGAARMARLGGGYTAASSDPILIGQVQSVITTDPAQAMQTLLDNKSEILSLANSMHPKMIARGGGALDIEVYHHVAEQDGRDMVVLHLLVDTRDAMGANLVNSMCEGVAALVEQLTGGTVFLRILSNLTDRAIAKASVQIPTANLEGKGFSGEAVRDGIILANDLALADPYRAATHNKGIMNGVDAVALATGNDWRAIEAAAHAYAARDGRYKALTRWYKSKEGDLVGEIEIPMKVGTVGGSLESNPSVRINHRLLGSPSATELASVMGAIGLAQNFAALRALSTNGIQQNHMNLHARSVASTAGVPDEYFETVVESLIESGEVKVWKAQEIVKNLSRKATRPEASERQSASGKIILLGEHAVVYGRPAIALPIPLAVEATVRKYPSDEGQGVDILIPRWGLEQKVHAGMQGLPGILGSILDRLNLLDEHMTIEVFPHVPRAMGLGGSSALAVAILRAVDHAFTLNLGNETINELAFECEKAAHGTPSGVDNTVATYGTPLIYRRVDDEPKFESLKLGTPLDLIVGITGKESLTADAVARVRKTWQQYPERYEAVFDQVADVTDAGREALVAGNLDEIGELMNLCHGYLNALQLSTPELEELIHIARTNGAVGAKLTGGGVGGSMIALCPDNKHGIEQAMQAAGFQTLEVTITN
ncbi:MAG: hydroxymethylglutaryl-CoA reductase, degradative [Pseudomonadales bacterium]|nr:hydroxymethylglutaryl-CoA reductase, degradative [Pseudomonadales bacterium]